MQNFVLSQILVPSDQKICKKKKRTQETAKNGKKWGKTKKTHIQSFNYTRIIKDSDGEFCAEFNGANPRAKNLSNKKLQPQKVVQKIPKWADKEKMLLQRVSQKNMFEVHNKAVHEASSLVM